MQALVDLFVESLSIVIGIGSLLLGVGLYWHFCRIGKIWIARTWWCLLVIGALATFGVGAVAGIAEPSTGMVVLSLLCIFLLGTVLTAPLWNPLPPMTRGFGPDELEAHKPAGSSNEF